LRLLITMNMPSGSDRLVHQVIVESEADSLAEFRDYLCTADFIHVRQFYHRVDEQTGSSTWVDRGDLVLNTHHIGKVQEFVEMDNDRSQNDFNQRSYNFERKRQPVRGGRGVF